MSDSCVMLVFKTSLILNTSQAPEKDGAALNLNIMK
jgi:hypothetical protein